MNATVFYHEPIMPVECINALDIKEDGVYVDGTAGGGGHSSKIAELVKTGKLICIDRDEEAINYAKLRLSAFNNVTFINDNYLNLKEILSINSVNKIDGLLLDLGVSSHQLDSAERGFSYMKDAPLDMRMDKKEPLDAYTVVNEYSEDRLVEIMFLYGEERFSKRIASNIVKHRRVKTIKTTLELAQIVEDSIPKSKIVKGSHPAKRVFQALRIEVNGELHNLSAFIKSLPDIINDNGRIAVISFHSLEDRIIKQAFLELQNPCKCPPKMPACVCGKKSMGSCITKKPTVPTETEIEKNPRSKSAKLRVFKICNAR